MLPERLFDCSGPSKASPGRRPARSSSTPFSRTFAVAAIWFRPRLCIHESPSLMDRKTGVALRRFTQPADLAVWPSGATHSPWGITAALAHSHVAQALVTSLSSRGINFGAACSKPRRPRRPPRLRTTHARSLAALAAHPGPAQRTLEASPPDPLVGLGAASGGPRPTSAAANRIDPRPSASGAAARGGVRGR